MHDKSARRRPEQSATMAFAHSPLSLSMQARLQQFMPRPTRPDPTKLQTSIVRSSDDRMLNGRNWYIIGAAHPLSRWALMMGVQGTGTLSRWTARQVSRPPHS